MFWVNYSQITPFYYRRMLLIHNQIFIEEKRVHTFKVTSLSRGRRTGRSFPNYPEYAEPSERKAINFLPPPESFRFPFPRNVFARTFELASWKNERRSKRAHNARPARIRFRHGTPPEKKNDCTAELRRTFIAN